MIISLNINKKRYHNNKGPPERLICIFGNNYKMKLVKRSEILK